MIEAWFRSLKHNWLFLNSLGSPTAVERLVAFYIQQHNEVIPNAVLGGRTPDEVFRGEAVDLPKRLHEKHRVAIAERIAANRKLECVACNIPRITNAPRESPSMIPRKSNDSRDVAIANEN